MNGRVYNELLVFDLDNDGDRNESFERCRNYITENLSIVSGTYYPGFFDSAYFHFTHKGISFRLEHSGMLGTELRCVLPLTDEEKEIALQLAQRLVEVLR